MSYGEQTCPQLRITILEISKCKLRVGMISLLIKYKLYSNCSTVSRLRDKNRTVFSAGCLTLGRLCSTVLNFKKTVGNWNSYNPKRPDWWETREECHREVFKEIKVVSLYKIKRKPWSLNIYCPVGGRFNLLLFREAKPVGSGCTKAGFWLCTSQSFLSIRAGQQMYEAGRWNTMLSSFCKGSSRDQMNSYQKCRREIPAWGGW